MPSTALAPVVSIIVPVYNAEKYLAQTLQSVQAQTLASWELIAVDDGGSDGSVDIIRKYMDLDQRIRLVQQANTGVAGARNRGFAESNLSSQYVIFLDQDDLWYADTLETLCRALETHIHCCAAFGQTQFIDAQNVVYSKENFPASVSELEKLVRQRTSVAGARYVELPEQAEVNFATFIVANCIVSPGGVLMRRSALPEGTLFDSQVAPCDDWDLYIRLTRLMPFRYVPVPTFQYRMHSTNASHNFELMLKAAHGVYWKAIRSAENTPAQYKMARMGQLYCEHRNIKDRTRWMREALYKGSYMEAAKQLRQFCIAQTKIRRMSAEVERLGRRVSDDIGKTDAFKKVA